MLTRRYLSEESCLVIGWIPSPPEEEKKEEIEKDLISLLREIPLFARKLAPMVTREVEGSRRRDSHHRWYYLSNRNRRSWVLQRDQT